MTTPLGQAWAYLRDAFGSVTQQELTNPSSVTATGPVAVGYDLQGNVVAVTDARGLATTYQRDGFGAVASVSSPDTGTTTYSRDLAENVLTRSNAAGLAETFTWDAANRR